MLLLREPQVRNRQGFTLLELLVGLVLGLIVLGGVVYVFVGNAQGSLFLLRSTRFNQDLRRVMDLMVTDIRRAGYQGPGADAGTVDNPFMLVTPGSINISIDRYGSGEAQSSCILFAYNRDSDDPPVVGYCSSGCSSVPTYSSVTFGTTSMEMYGYRLRDGAVEMRTGPRTGVTTFDCASGTWQDVTDTNNMTVTSLQFARYDDCVVFSSSGIAHDSTCSAGSSGDVRVRRTDVRITLGGRVASDSTVQQQLQEKVTLQNEQVSELP